jgi:hypothetical protein
MQVCTLLSSGIIYAEETTIAQPPPEIVIDAPAPTQSPVKQEIERTKTVTIYDSQVLPGFRPCTTEDYRKQDTDPVACQDEEASRVISTRESQSVSEDLIVEDNAVPQGNIFKLNFERFKKNK